MFQLNYDTRDRRWNNFCQLLYLGGKHARHWLPNKLIRLEAVSCVFLSLCIKAFCAICFVTEGGREAKETKVGVKLNTQVH